MTDASCPTRHFVTLREEERTLIEELLMNEHGNLREEIRRTADPVFKDALRRRQETVAVLLPRMSAEEKVP